MEYLEKYLPDISSNKDIYNVLEYIYKCKFCSRHYPIWWVSDKDWEKSGFGFLEKAAAAYLGKELIDFRDETGGVRICKECFEQHVQYPNYFTIDE
jgi:hypothetical protein